MKIQEINLKKFKRFTDLKITGLSDALKLVVMIGPNGCGKSSVFDAIYAFVMMNYRGFEGQSWKYYNKESIQMTSDIQNQEGLQKRTKVIFHGGSPTTIEGWQKSVYPRTAYRNVTSFDVKELTQTPPALGEHRVSRFSHDDKAANNNYFRLVSKGLQDAFEKERPETTMKQFRRNVIGEITDGLQKMFPDLLLNSLRNPLAGGGTFSFDKGDSKGFLYENLSGGEKAAFDLILDLIVKRPTFDDTVYCIDEPEAHMSTRLQKDLLNCIYDLIPDQCQLWIATHSIGMIRKALELQRENPDAVAFLDFGDKDFDKPQVIEPVSPTRTFWQKTYEIALDDLAKLVVPARIILCEGDPGKDGFDARCYNAIFNDEFTETLFVSAKGKGNIKNLKPVVQAIVDKAEVIPLIDRDNKTDDERARAIQDGTRVLNRRALENYLIDDEVIHLLCAKLQTTEKTGGLIELRNNKIQNGNVRSGKAKEAVEAIRLAVDSLTDQPPGKNWQGFAHKFMVPLITPDTAIYKELKSDIFRNDTMSISEANA